MLDLIEIVFCEPFTVVFKYSKRKFMTEKIKRINNPLTIIAIFAALAEINATVALGLIDKELHYIFIWFVICFPTILVILFFLTLNFNTKVMYSPSDYSDDRNFMDSLFGNYYGDKKENKEEFNPIALLTELENKLTEKLQLRFDDIIRKNSNNPELQKEIEGLKSVTDESINEVRNLYSISTDLKQLLLGFFRFPAFYTIIYAIVKSNARSVEELKKSIDRYYLPGEWEESGFPKLLAKEILIGDNSKFEINPKYKAEIEMWVDQNTVVLRLMNDSFRLEQKDASKENRVKIREKTRELAEKLKL